MGVNPNTNRIYVANSGVPNVLVIDGNADSIIATIGGVTTPQDVVVNPFSNRVFVTILGAPGNVLVIDGDTNRIVSTIGAGNAPRGVAVMLL